MIQRLPSRLSLPTALFCWAWLSFHFFCTAIYLAPTSTLQTELFDVVSQYMRPRFSQRWALFAPDPDGTTRHFGVACRIEQLDGSIRETPLYDVTERFYASPWLTRLGPDARLLRAYLSVSLILDRDDKYFEVLRYRSRRDPALKESLTSRLAELSRWRTEYASELASRIGSAECQRQFPNEKIAGVAPAIDVSRPPPFFLTDPAPRPPLRVEFGWQPFTAGLRSL